MATLKQKRVVAKILENGGSVSRAMRDVGYSPNTAATPKNLTKSKTFQELLEKALPDDLLLKVHKEGLKAMKYEVLGGGGEDGWSKEEVPDYATRHKYMQTGYDLKGRAKPESTPSNTTNNIMQINIYPDAQVTGHTPNSETILSVEGVAESRDS